MPILPENILRYPDNWKEIREKILTRAGQIRDESGKIIQEAKCEKCGVENHSMRNGKKIVLTIAHLDHTPENCSDNNLLALCQKDHNSYDAQERVKNRKVRKWCQMQITQRIRKDYEIL
jgi:hypothetical protein